MSGWTRQNLDFFDMQRIMLKLVESVEIFSGFTQNELAELLANTEKCIFEAGSMILTEGSSGSFMYVILAGEVDISKKLGGGKRRVLARLCAGDCFGEMSLVDSDVRSATVIAASKCTLIRIGENDFHGKPASGAKLFRNIARLLSHRLRNTNAMVSLRLSEDTLHGTSCPAPLSETTLRSTINP